MCSTRVDIVCVTIPSGLECVVHVLISCVLLSHPQAVPARSRYVPPSLQDKLEDIGQMR